MHKKIFHWFLVSTLLLLVFALQMWPDSNIHIISCDVGQGDSTLIIHGFTQVLIDGGPSSKVTDCLNNHIPWFDREVELVVLTHPEQDHMAGLVDVLSEYSVKLLLANAVINETETFGEFRSLVLAKGLSVYNPHSGDVIRAGKMQFRTLWPSENSYPEVEWWNRSDIDKNSDNYNKIDQQEVLRGYQGDLNQLSIVLELDYGEVVGLFVGDIGSREEQALLGMGVIKPVNVLKVAHHGSKYSSTPSFLDVSKPEWALVSVGEGNKFGHPSGATLRYLDIVGSKILRTDELGTIELVTDGERVWQK